MSKYRKLRRESLLGKSKLKRLKLLNMKHTALFKQEGKEQNSSKVTKGYSKLRFLVPN